MKAPTLAAFLIFCMSGVPSAATDDAPQVAFLGFQLINTSLEPKADWAAWGTVQKVSNLILNINVYMEDARAGKLQFVKSVDIRGNSDESWRRGLDYLLRHYLFSEP